MAAPDPKRPTYTVEAIPSDVKNGLFLGNAAVDNLMACMISMGAEVWATKRGCVMHGGDGEARHHAGDDRDLRAERGRGGGVGGGPGPVRGPTLGRWPTRAYRPDGSTLPEALEREHPT